MNVCLEGSNPSFSVSAAAGVSRRPGVTKPPARLASRRSRPTLSLVPLVGRDVELAAVDSYLQGVGAAALLIVGEPGIGKTTLWEEAIRRARADSDTPALVARPTEAEAKLSFAGDTLGVAALSHW